MLRSALGLAIAIAAIASAAAMPPVETLGRAGQWEVNYDDDVCYLIGQFGTGDSAVAIRFSRTPLDEGFDFAVFGKRIAALKQYAAVRVDWGNGEVEATNVLAAPRATPPTLLLGEFRLDGWKPKTEAEKPPAVAPAREASVTGVSIAISGQPSFRLDFGSLGKPFEALRACERNLLQHWGFDPEVQTHLSRKAEPIGMPMAWVTPYDLRGNATFARANGEAKLRLDVDDKGALAGCHVVVENGVSGLGAAACAVLPKHARFRPALDAKGAAVGSFYVHEIRWTPR